MAPRGWAASVTLTIGFVLGMVTFSPEALGQAAAPPADPDSAPLELMQSAPPDDPVAPREAPPDVASAAVAAPASAPPSEAIRPNDYLCVVSAPTDSDAAELNQMSFEDFKAKTHFNNRRKSSSVVYHELMELVPEGFDVPLEDDGQLVFVCYQPAAGRQEGNNFCAVKDISFFRNSALVKSSLLDNVEKALQQNGYAAIP